MEHQDGRVYMKTPELDWRLHAPMVFKILTDCEYLAKVSHINFTMDSSGTIHLKGGWPYSPSEIRGFDDAQSVFRDNGCAFVHYDAICILKGESFQRLLVEGRKLLVRLATEGWIGQGLAGPLFGGRHEVQT